VSAAAPAARATASPLGVYVHIPFCATRCDYCDFATWTDRAGLVDDYVAACVTDIERRVRRGELVEATSVFFGGGTPSLLDAAALVRVLDAIPRRGDAEVTVECNPDTVDGAKLRAYQRGGVNRCSVGVQSLRPHVLAALGRTHDPAGVARALDAARDAGITRLNVDLIYGAAGETFEQWDETLTRALALEPAHVSAYGLTVEAGAEVLDPAARRVEGLQLALRTAGGVPVDAFDPADLTGPFAELVEVRRDAEGHDHAVLTVPGRLLANEVALRLR